MASRNVQIKLGSNGLGYITVDGHDIAGAVQAIVVESSAGEPPRVVLHLPYLDALEVHPEQVVLPERVVEALRHLGWTPPPEVT